MENQAGIEYNYGELKEITAKEEKVPTQQELLNYKKVIRFTFMLANKENLELVVEKPQ